MNSDRDNARAKSILAETDSHVTVDVETVTLADIETAWAIGERFPDQNFSIVDRTSFAVMERLRITSTASFDRDFAVYRYGRARDKAFEIIR